MICSECNCTYLEANKDRKNTESLYGLCVNCGTEPKYAEFLSSYVTGIIFSLLSFWLILALSISSAWRIWVLVAIILTCVYVGFHFLIRSAEPVYYQNADQRRRHTLLQKISGWIVGFLIVSFLVFEIVLRYV